MIPKTAILTAQHGAQLRPAQGQLDASASNGRGNGFIAVGEKLHHTKLRLYKELKSFWMGLYAEDDLFLPNIPLCNYCVL